MNFDDMLERVVEDTEFCEEYDPLEQEYSVKAAILHARKEKNMTQAQLSKVTGIDRGDISKLERGEGNPTLSSLERLADGLGMRLKLEFVPQ